MLYALAVRARVGDPVRQVTSLSAQTQAVPPTAPPADRLARVAPWLAGIAVAVAVCLPWLGGGYLWLLDYVVGPHSPVLGPQVYGLDGGLVAALPLNMVVAWAGHLPGGSGTLVLPFAFFPVASAAAASLAGGRTGTRVVAGLAYCVNPFVYDRFFAGQLGLMAGYAILPWAVASLLRLPGAKGLSWLRTALCWAALVATSPHFAWIFAIPVAVVALAHRLRRTVVIRLVVVTVSTALTTSYALATGAAGGIGQHIGLRNLAEYATQPDKHLGLAVNVAALYGFWRVGPPLAKEVVTGWPALLAAMYLLAAAGYLHQFRRPDASFPGRKGAAVLALSGGLGLLAAMGAHGPTGPLYRWAYLHVPYFAVMREAQKFDMLVALGLSVGLGWGVGLLVESAVRPGVARTWLGLGLLLPLVYEPLLFYGLAGNVSTTSPPSGWMKADRIMGRGQGRVLVLPWHQYLSFPYTANRVIANPAAGLLTRPVISGDNVQLPGLPTTSTSPRSAFLTYVFAHGGQVRHFGALLAPLGVRYVLVEKTIDWRSYSWLAHQADLTRVLDTRSVALYRNDVASPPGEIVRSAVHAPRWSSLLANQGQVAHVALLSPSYRARRGAAVGTLAPSSSPRSDLETAKRTSPVTYSVPPAPPGSWVQLSEPYTRGWVLDGHAAVPLAEGNLGWPAPARGGTAVFRPWHLARLGYLVSVATTAALVAAVVWDRRRRRPVSREHSGAAS
ncbi:MAG: hypothetical protein M0Z87_02985 [Actinomycetota bacterium]|nr:hypothetical protein [Actinomycetota bacterium]